MPKGSVEYDPAYITPKKVLGSPEAYSAASVVNDLSPIKNSKRAAEANSLQESFQKSMDQATKKRKIGGKKRKTKRRMTKRR